MRARRYAILWAFRHEASGIPAPASPPPTITPTSTASTIPHGAGPAAHTPARHLTPTATAPPGTLHHNSGGGTQHVTPSDPPPTQTAALATAASTLLPPPPATLPTLHSVAVGGLDGGRQGVAARRAPPPPPLQKPAPANPHPSPMDGPGVSPWHMQLRGANPSPGPGGAAPPPRAALGPAASAAAVGGGWVAVGVVGAVSGGPAPAWGGPAGTGLQSLLSVLELMEGVQQMVALMVSRGGDPLFVPLRRLGEAAVPPRIQR